jgi:hypothetical protein
MNRKLIRETAACGLGLRLPYVPATYYTITPATADTFSVPGLKNDLADQHGAEDLFINDAGVSGQDRRVVTWDYPTDDDVHLATSVALTANVDFYAAMAASEMNAAINEALPTLSFVDDSEVSLVADQNVVILTSTLAWLTRRRQLLELRYRYTSATNKVVDWPVRECSVDEYIDTTSKVRVQLWDVPSDITNIKLQVRARHYYGTLDTDAAITTCPDPLIVTAAKVWIIKRLPSRLADSYKERYSLFSRELTEQRLQFNSIDADRPLVRRYRWDGPEVPVESWEW